MSSSPRKYIDKVESSPQMKFSASDLMQCMRGQNVASQDKKSPKSIVDQQADEELDVLLNSELENGMLLFNQFDVTALSSTIKVNFLMFHNCYLGKLKWTNKPSRFSFGKKTMNEASMSQDNAVNISLSRINSFANSTMEEDCIIKERTGTVMMGQSQFERNSDGHVDMENANPNMSTCNNFNISTQAKDSQDYDMISTLLNAKPLNSSKTPVISKCSRGKESLIPQNDCGMDGSNSKDPKIHMNFFPKTEHKKSVKMTDSHVKKLLKSEEKVIEDMQKNQFKPLPYQKSDYAEIKGIPYILPNEVTHPHPFKLSTSNMGSKCKKDAIESQSPRHFDTKVDSVNKSLEWPQSSNGKQGKRRSVSQQFKRDSKLDHHGFRVTFTNKPGQNCTVPLRTHFRAMSRCDQCHNHLEEIPEASHIIKARNMPIYKEFVIKKPVTKPTVPRAPRLNTTNRSKVREQYHKKAEEYRRQIKEKDGRRPRDKTPTFNLNF